MSLVSKIIKNNHEKEVIEDVFLNADIHTLSLKAFHKDQNQDGLIVIGSDENTHVLVVVDGMGGHQGGEKASSVILDTINDFFSKKTNFTSLENIRNTMLSAILEADKQVKDLKIGAGATFVGAIVYENQIQILNSGDAKGYLLGSKGKQKFETVEHSPAGYYKEAKGETSENIEDNIISNGVGFEPMSIEISQILEISNHDILLLCSDGLFHIYPEAEVADWASTGKFETRLKELSEHIEKTGPEKLLADDTTLILSRFKRN